MTFARCPIATSRALRGRALASPLAYAPIVRDPTLIQMMMIGFFSMMAFVMMESTFAAVLQGRVRLRHRAVGLFFGFAGIVIIIIQGGLIGRLTKRFHEWPIVIAGPLIVTLAMAIYVMAGFWPLLILLLVGGLFNAIGRSLQTPACRRCSRSTRIRRCRGESLA